MRRNDLPKPFDIVVLTWVDAYVDSLAQFDDAHTALSAYAPRVRKTLGYWMGCKNGVMALATDDDRADSRPEACAGVFYCPAALVQHIEIVRADA